MTLTVILNWAQQHKRLFVFLLIMTLVLAFSAVFIVAALTWEYTNSAQFCGTTCHTMPPEYAAYQLSPHARVPCVDCHLGQESVISALPRKAKEIRHVLFALTRTYEVPIYVRSLRPARFTCEKCHNPDKFSSDRFQYEYHFLPDERNTERIVTLIMKTGGGSKREGLGMGIHWHIENEVWFIATDSLRQNIPYVRQIDEQGKVTEYYDVEANLPPDFIERNMDKLHRMDCIDCHNRISHKFPNPDTAVDEALFTHRIPRDIPQIKAVAVEVLSITYPNHAQAREAIAQRVLEYYRIRYEDWYANPENRSKLQKAIAELQSLYSRMVFPDMKVSWDVHPDNEGHKDFPGCFRCHDGKHLSKEGKPIRLECNICHSIPIVIGPGLPTMAIPLVKPEEPDSHRDPMWIARHRYEFDHSCAGCHNVTNAGGTDNSSFCANSACHATEWRFAGLNAPEIRRTLEEEVRQKKAGQPRPEPGVAPPIPHPIGPRIDCDICHGTGTVRAYPEDHLQEEMANCTECHVVTRPEAIIGSPSK